MGSNVTAVRSVVPPVLTAGMEQCDSALLGMLRAKEGTRLPWLTLTLERSSWVANASFASFLTHWTRAVPATGESFSSAVSRASARADLADELSSIATEQRQLVLWGRAWEDAGAPAYWPWIQALRTLIRSSTPDQVRGNLGIGASDVAQMLPELRVMFPDLSRTARRGVRVRSLPALRFDHEPPAQRQPTTGRCLSSSTISTRPTHQRSSCCAFWPAS